MNRVILLTGASGGIGSALARQLTACGDVVVETDVQPGLDAQLDVTSRVDWERVIHCVLERHDRIDVLLNVAGIAAAGHFWELDPAEIDRHVDINLKGAALGTRLVLPHMVARHAGHIVNIASLAGLAPVPGIALYSATKSAMRAFSIALAIELGGTGVSVSVVHPDLVDTPMIEQQRLQPEAAYSFSGGRTLTAAEVAQVVVRRVLVKKPLEVAIPGHRGALCKVLSAFPSLARTLAPSLRRKGLLRQVQEQRARKGR